MNKHHAGFALVSLALVGLLISASPVRAQVAGATTSVGVSVVESTQLAMGWSVTQTLLGKTVYNEAGKKVGNVVDLIISPDKSVSYVIVGAGGFVGIGRHDVAIPVTQIQENQGKLIMPGASKDMVKAMPEFNYATNTTRRDRFVAIAEKDIVKGNAKVAELAKKANGTTDDAKAKLDLQSKAIQMDVKSVEGQLNQMKEASVDNWRNFEANVKTATARLRKSIQAAAI